MSECDVFNQTNQPVNLEGKQAWRFKKARLLARVEAKGALTMRWQPPHCQWSLLLVKLIDVTMLVRMGFIADDR